MKREDLAHTGAHKINNTIGQALLAKHMGKDRLIAETGAGQHGVAVATASALLGLKCVVYMGSKDIVRQAQNVFKMKVLGAEVISVDQGTGTLKDAINEALRDWAANVDTTHYVIGSVVGPHPYPKMVRDFQSVIGKEALRQIKSQAGCLPHCLVACVGGGSNAMGLFFPFLRYESVKMWGVEAAGNGTSGLHSQTLGIGNPGILHGSLSYLLQDRWGQIRGTYSIAAGLDYPGVGPEHAFLKDTKRVNYVSVGDEEALDAFQEISRYEGIIPALESAHALAYARQLSSKCLGSVILVNLSGRGDKDLKIIEEVTDVKD